MKALVGSFNRAERPCSPVGTFSVVVKSSLKPSDGLHFLTSVKTRGADGLTCVLVDTCSSLFFYFFRFIEDQDEKREKLVQFFCRNIHNK